MRSLILILLFGLRLQAQELPPATRQGAEWQAEEGREGAAEEWAEDLRPFLRQPLDLNRATADDLRAFPFLHAVQVEQFLRYRHLLGSFLHPLELQAIPGWDPATIRQILPYVYTGDPRSLAEQLKDRLHGTQHLALLFSGNTAKRDPAHLGTPWALQLRYRYQYKNLLSAGITADKDGGEEFFRGSQKQGFDQYSAHVFLRQVGPFETLALGDFRLRLGQGLVHWDGASLGPGANPLLTERAAPAISPYRSASASGFQRGVGATLQKGSWRLTVFAGQRKLDANLRVDGSASSLQTSGYHRTVAELADRRVLLLRTAGFRLERQGGPFRLGLNTISYGLSRRLDPDAEPYNRYAFRGRHLALASIDGSGTWRNLHLFGELAGSREARSFLVGLLAALHQKADLSLAYRRFPPAYAPLFAQSFSRYGEPQNESGVYLGIDLRPHPAWQLTLAADLYQSPFIRYRVPAAASGASFWAQANFRPDKKRLIYARLRFTEKAAAEQTAPINPVVPARLLSLRFHLDQVLGPSADISARLEWNRFRSGASEGTGMLFYLDHTRMLQRLRLTLRWQWVDMDSYENRIYAYVPSLPMSFALPAASGRNSALYLLARYPVWPAVRAELRWLLLFGREEGSLAHPGGNGNVSQEWGLYLVWQF